MQTLKYPQTTKNIRLVPTHFESLTKLASIFDQATKECIKNKNITPQRVDTSNEPTNSINATSPLHIKKRKIIHQKQTRRNTPINLKPTIDDTPKQYITPSDDGHYEKENIVHPLTRSALNQKLVHTIPPENSAPFKPRQSCCIIHTTKNPTNIVKAALYQFLGKASKPNNNTTRPRKLKNHSLCLTYNMYVMALFIQPSAK